MKFKGIFTNKNFALDDVEIRLRVTNLWVGWPKEHKTFAHPRDIPVGMLFFSLSYLYVFAPYNLWKFFPYLKNTSSLINM